MTQPIVVVGSINMDLVCTADRLPQPGETIIGADYSTYSGGKGANQAVAVARLAHPVFMVGKLGEDTFGEELRHALEQAGVDTSHVTASAAPSGTALITTDRAGRNTIVVIPGANAELHESDIDASAPLIARAGMVLAQLEIPLATVEHLARLCARLRVPLMLDPAPARQLPAELLTNVAWLTPNETETEHLLGDAPSLWSDVARAERLLDLRVKGVAMKMGERGAFLAARDLRCAMPAYTVPVVDTTAAGDAFNAGFAVALVRGLGIQEAARYSMATAALSVTRRGAQLSMPSAAEVQRFLNQHRENQHRKDEPPEGSEEA